MNLGVRSPGLASSSYLTSNVTLTKLLDPEASSLSPLQYLTHETV